ncbi:hypothetical protein H2199_003093 [Coniosporium tulheliwenetii]|uniref:Uncharacterized protein n=1 Tax=Coniosporium tulheliwenetii TaxID=3383036 RepID=A0ACC2ZC13_9PEZI|nr:hypothetical protein H2199_003093 [Cladosporium sp. JES 115]
MPEEKSTMDARRRFLSGASTQASSIYRGSEVRSGTVMALFAAATNRTAPLAITVGKIALSSKTLEGEEKC